jgi:hypothetical protein
LISFKLSINNLSKIQITCLGGKAGKIQIFNQRKLPACRQTGELIIENLLSSYIRQHGQKSGALYGIGQLARMFSTKAGRSSWLNSCPVGHISIEVFCLFIVDIGNIIFTKIAFLLHINSLFFCHPELGSGSYYCLDSGSSPE